MARLATGRDKPRKVVAVGFLEAWSWRTVGEILRHLAWRPALAPTSGSFCGLTNCTQNGHLGRANIKCARRLSGQHQKAARRWNFKTFARRLASTNPTAGHTPVACSRTKSFHLAHTGWWPAARAAGAPPNQRPLALSLVRRRCPWAPGAASEKYGILSWLKLSKFDSRDT